MKPLESLLQSYVELHPEDAARAVETLNTDDAVRMVEALPESVATGLIERLSPHIAAPIVHSLGAERALGLLSEIGPRAASAIVHHWDDETRDSMLEKLPERVARQLRQLASYPPETAGAMMDPHVVSFPLDLNVEQATSAIRKAPRDALHYLYVTQRDGQLAGVLTMRDLLLASPRDSIAPLVRRHVVTVPETMSSEDVVAQMRERRFLALPVVDVDGRLIGVVKHDDALETGQAEAFEDLQRMVGVGGDERALSPVKTAVARRLPWLLVNLATAFLASAVVGLFEATLVQVAALAVLLPVVSGQGGNGGAQSMAIVMRGLALREILVGNQNRVIIKELAVGFCNSLAIAFVTSLCVYFWKGSVSLSLVIGLAMVVNMVAASLAGAVIPLLLRALGRDPAQSASIFLTTVTDIVGFAAFLGFAMLFMEQLKTSLPS